MLVTNAETILWRANTARHDWTAAPPIARLLAAASRLELIGPVDAAEVSRGRGGRLQGVAPTSLAEALLALRPDRKGVVDVQVRGDTPAPWELAWNVYPFDRESGWAHGLSSWWLRADRSRVRGRAASDALLAAFFEVHACPDVEYAVLHPYGHTRDFPADDEPPITHGAQLRALYWANFLGPGHLDEFDPDKLRALAAHELHWVDPRGLFIVTAPELDLADAPATEPELLRLRAACRDALRPGSRWR